MSARWRAAARPPPYVGQMRTWVPAGIACVSGLLLLAARPPASKPAVPSSVPTAATLAVPGPAPFAPVAREVVQLAFVVDPSLAANAGLYADALRVPALSPAAVQATTARLDTALGALRAMPVASWPIDAQIDHRWVYAVAETLRHQLVVERMYTHRAAQWLEPVANTVIAFTSYAPEHPEWQRDVLARVPAMLVEIDAVCTEPTVRDLHTARGLAAALSAAARGTGQVDVAAALDAWTARLDTLHPPADAVVVGAEAYTWRYGHSLLLPWTPPELLAHSRATLGTIDARLATLPPVAPPPAPTEAQQARAAALDRDGLLAIYDGIQEANRAATVAGGWVTIPAGVGPVRSRETPAALAPLTGDGGSMNPPPTYGGSDVGYWNVERFRPEWGPAERIGKILTGVTFRDTGMGPYAAHEGFPGHHLQLAIARLHPDPLRSILPDSALNEGWGLYAEEVFWAHGGLGSSPGAERSMLRSYRARANRVVYDVNVETGAWSLQQAADYKYGAAPGEGPVDEDLLRTLQWPTQLVGYYAGKAQIVALREEVRASRGAAWDERAFHDAFLAEGSIPVALIRAKLLGVPLPPLDPPAATPAAPKAAP